MFPRELSVFIPTVFQLQEHIHCQRLIRVDSRTPSVPTTPSPHHHHSLRLLALSLVSTGNPFEAVMSGPSCGPRSLTDLIIVPVLLHAN